MGIQPGARTMLVLCSAALAAACQHDQGSSKKQGGDEPYLASKHPSAADTPQTVVGPEAEATLEAIAHASCARDARCGRVGDDREHADYEACVEKVKMQYVYELNSTACRWFDPDALATCVGAIHEEGCNGKLRALSRRLACQAGSICRLGAPPNR